MSGLLFAVAYWLLVFAECRSQIPLFVICFNQPGYIRNSVEQYKKFTSRIVLVDNHSNDKDLLSFYNSLANDSDVQVIRMQKNWGHKVVFDAELAANEWAYAVTDPDLQLNENTPENFMDVLFRVTEELKIGKAGLALNISNHLPFRNFRHSQYGRVREWESRFWTNRIHATTKTAALLELYSAPIDTTFAVYNKNYFHVNTFFDAVRVAGDFTALHLPWLSKLPEHLVVNDTNYFDTKLPTVGTWNVRNSLEEQIDADLLIASGWDNRAESIFLTQLAAIDKETPVRIKIPLLNKSIRVVGDQAFWTLFDTQHWELDSLRTFSRCINKRVTVVDFGAWVGPTLLFHSCLSLRSIGIEGDPAAYAKLLKNVNLNRDDSIIEIFPGVVSVAEGQQTMRSAQAGNSCSGLSSVACGIASMEWSVRGYTLPHFFASHLVAVDSNTFIKIDIESYECSLLPAIAEWLLNASTFNNKPTIFVAMHAQIRPCNDADLRVISSLARSYRFASCTDNNPVWDNQGKLVCIFQSELLMTDSDTCNGA